MYPIKSVIKILAVIQLVSCFFLPSTAQIKQDVKPEKVVSWEKTINQNWTFNYFPDKNGATPDFEWPSYDDSKWSYISLPHTWQTYETTMELHPYIRSASAEVDPYWWKGWGCYRKHLIIGKVYQNKKIFLEFDGVQKYAKVYLNGKYLGDHKGGYTSFYLDATDAVKFGEDNLLAVAVNNDLKDQFNIPPMNAGNFDVYGGIHRDVHLVIKDKLNIPFQGSYKHEGGTFITTPKVSDEEAEIQIKTYIQNQYDTEKRVQLVTQIADSVGHILDKMESILSIKPGQIAEFVQTSVPVKKPNLWSPENPYLYKVSSAVYDGDQLTDFQVSAFGIRTFYWNYTLHRLVLNGKITQLHGINRHEEYVWLGAAFPKWIAQRDMLDIANGLEANFMRTAHYPQDPSIYNFTDRHGICINEELPNIKKQEFNDQVQEQNCQEMIRRDRNHPSILFWSMGNETTDACDSKIAVKEDTTRILTVRQPYNESYNPLFIKHTDKEMPLESFLRCTIKGWYDKDDRNLEPEDNQWAGTEEWQHTQSNKETISDHNGAVWLYADHGANREYVNAPLKFVNPKGWVDSWRNPKYAYYQWQANFAKKPMVFIHPHFWRKQYVGQKRDFVVDSNCEQVELFLNGKSKGSLHSEKSNNYCVTFKNILVEAGTLEAVATGKNGSKITYKVTLAGEPAALTIRSTSGKMYSSPDHVTEFKVDIVDDMGIHVIGANNPIKFKVEGPARLVGPDLYQSDRDKSEAYEGTMYIDAPVTNLIRATGRTGWVKVTVSSTGLKSASTEIEVVQSIDHHLIPGISETPLQLDGREPVAVNLKKANFIKAPAEMKTYAGEVRFSTSKMNQYPNLIKEFLVKENPKIETNTPDFEFVLSAMTAILNSTGKYNGTYGYIVADDYNFIVNQYNLSRSITKKIALKLLPEAYRNVLINYYASQIIKKGTDRNSAREIEIIDQIPVGGKACIVTEKNDLKDVICTNETDLTVLLLKIYPEVAGYKSDELKRALTLIERLNPCISYKSVRDKKSKERKDSYTIESGGVILIPDENQLLKASIPDKKL